MSHLNLVDCTIDELQGALSSGALTSVDLVARLLRRVSKYDYRGPALNSIPILNPLVFREAAESDDRRASGATVRPLEGIPWTAKDSYKVEGMTAAAASPAFQHLVSNEDAYLVAAVREAGGVLLGQTNMPAMASGGMARGIYGRAESPYNGNYLAAAWASGSSNGSSVSTATSFASFGLGSETVSSGRSPASNNAVIAYTPSKSYLSSRGLWPLYPTCDVPVPCTRTMEDMFTVLDVLAKVDPIIPGDLWREQKFVQVPRPWYKRPESFTELREVTNLKGLRIAVPEMYIGGPTPPGAKPVHTSLEVIELWQAARKDLESLGAEIVLTPEFPATIAYENDDMLPEGCPQRPDNWNAMERGALIAHAWNYFLKTFEDAEYAGLDLVDTSNIYPDSLRTEAEMRNFEQPNALQYHLMKGYLKSTNLFGIKGLEQAVKGLEGMRKVLFEDWLDRLGCHCAAFPAAGDVGPATADRDFEASDLAWRNGVHYSTGNRSIRHLGIPTVSVPMGRLKTSRMPMNLTIAGKAYDDVKILGWAHAFEKATNHRVPPPLTPVLDTDIIRLTSADPTPPKSHVKRPKLVVKDLNAIPRTENANKVLIVISGIVTIHETASLENLTPRLEITIDADAVPEEDVTVQKTSRDGVNSTFSFTVEVLANKPVERAEFDKTMAPVARDQNLCVILARAVPGGRPSGWLGLI